MGYTTAFRGQLVLNKQLTDEDSQFLKDLNSSRRMKRDIQGFGVDGEFYVDSAKDGDMGQSDKSGVVDYNSTPETQPSLWCQWVPTEDARGIEWDGGEKAYYMPEWLIWIINRYLEPRGYVLNGLVEAQGEEHGDIWAINVKNNVVYTQDIQGKLNAKGWVKMDYPRAPKIAALEAPSNPKSLPAPEK
jgi:hypothetical protein